MTRTNGIAAAGRGLAYKAAIAIVVAPLLAGCASSQGGRSGSLPEILNDARAHPESRLANAVACERFIAARPSDFPYRSFFAGLFNVAEESGGRAFCAALIEAVIAGDLSQQEWEAFQRPKQVRGKAPLGTLLRELMVAHERLYAQQAQRPLQAKSCSCGQ